MASFILENIEEILVDWESFARTLSPEMDSPALRDHAKSMLQAIAKDIETSQTEAQKSRKSRGLGPAFKVEETAAAAHGIVRQIEGFDLSQLVAEFRALRATVLRLWIAKEGYGDADSAYEMARFNEGIDQALAESVATFSEELTKSRDTFLAILGHDMRSPLSALASVLHILAKPVSDDVRAKALAAGENSVSSMSEMISNLLEYARTQLGKAIPIKPVEANFDVVLKKAINEVTHIYPQTAFTFESEGRLDGIFDSSRVHQAVSNLLNNAVHHGTPDMPVMVTLKGDDAAITLKVKNQGLPIAAGLLETIFDPLVQIPKSESQGSRSMNVGLGLFIARGIVVAHGGTIRVSSSAKAGTMFTVKLPRDVDKHKGAANAGRG